MNEENDDMFWLDNNNCAPSILRSLCEIGGFCFGLRYLVFFRGSGSLPYKKINQANITFAPTTRATNHRSATASRIGVCVAITRSLYTHALADVIVARPESLWAINDLAISARSGNQFLLIGSQASRILMRLWIPNTIMIVNLCVIIWRICAFYDIWVVIS